MLNVAYFAIRVVSQFGLLFVPTNAFIDSEFESEFSPEQDQPDTTASSK